VCCTYLQIDALEKPPLIRCDHLKVLQKGKGGGMCSKYEERPKECQDYQCLWLSYGIGDYLRPDKSGLLLTGRNLHGLCHCVQIAEVTRGSYRKNLRHLDRLMKRTKWPSGALIVLQNLHGHFFLVGGPHHLIEGFRQKKPFPADTHPSLLRWRGVDYAHDPDGST
jgi:hypothetical protein